MKKLLSAVFCLCVLSLGAQAQESFGIANSATGTTLNTLTKVVNTAGTPQAQIMATTDTSGAVGITTLGNGTSGTAIITRSGIAPCVFDNTTVAGDFVQIASGTAGDCHDVGSTRPTSGQIIGVVIQAGGAAGTYNVLLDKSILPSSSSATAPLCSVIGSSDTITTATSFASVCPVPSAGLASGSFLHVLVHGVYTTSATASPVSSFEVNAGGTTGVCTHGANNALQVSVTNVAWDLDCKIQIATTGAPGTAFAWGLDEAATAANGATFVSKMFMNTGSVSFTTNSTQNISIQQISTLVSGESFTLQSLVVQNY